MATKTKKFTVFYTRRSEEHKYLNPPVQAIEVQAQDVDEAFESAWKRSRVLKSATFTGKGGKRHVVAYHQEPETPVIEPIRDSMTAIEPPIELDVEFATNVAPSVLEELITPDKESIEAAEELLGPEIMSLTEVEKLISEHAHRPVQQVAVPSAQAEQITEKIAERVAQKLDAGHGQIAGGEANQQTSNFEAARQAEWIDDMRGYLHTLAALGVLLAAGAFVCLLGLHIEPFLFPIELAVMGGFSVLTYQTRKK